MERQFSLDPTTANLDTYRTSEAFPAPFTTQCFHRPVAISNAPFAFLAFRHA